MRILTSLVLALAMFAPSSHAAEPPPPHHPILGVWMLTFPDGSCSETYRFRGDGTTVVSSAEEVSVSEFTIPAEPSPKGFYKLEDKIVKDNGKEDCSGSIMKVGSEITNFVHFHPSGVLFLMCANESLDACIGPFRRVIGLDT